MKLGIVKIMIMSNEPNLTYRVHFGFNRGLLIQGSRITDELSFEEYRAQFYSVQPRPIPIAITTNTTATINLDNHHPSHSTISTPVPNLTTPEQFGMSCSQSHEKAIVQTQIATPTSVREMDEERDSILEDYKQTNNSTYQMQNNDNANDNNNNNRGNGMELEPVTPLSRRSVQQLMNRPTMTPLVNELQACTLDADEMTISTRVAFNEVSRFFVRYKRMELE